MSDNLSQPHAEFRDVKTRIAQLLAQLPDDKLEEMIEFIAAQGAGPSRKSQASQSTGRLHGLATAPALGCAHPACAQADSDKAD